MDFIFAFIHNNAQFLTGLIVGMPIGALLLMVGVTHTNAAERNREAQQTAPPPPARPHPRVTQLRERNRRQFRDRDV